MRRVRISTWVLTAIFLAALVAYVLVKPSSAATIAPQQAPSQPPRSTSPAPRTLLPGVIPGAVLSPRGRLRAARRAAGLRAAAAAGQGSPSRHGRAIPQGWHPAWHALCRPGLRRRRGHLRPGPPRLADGIGGRHRQ